MKLNATHADMDGTFLPELRFDLNWTIAKCKDFLERKFGTNPADMRLQLQNKQAQAVAQMADNDKTLGSYNPSEGYTVHVIDDSGNAVQNEFEDVSKVEKYQISEESYAKREDSVRAQKNKMTAAGDPNSQKDKGDGAVIGCCGGCNISEDFMKEESEAISVDQRCQLTVGERRGCVKYVGKVPAYGAGYWIGVLLDEPTGESDGKIKTKQYFEAGAKCATFVRPNDLQVGDFPEIDPFDELEDEI